MDWRQDPGSGVPVTQALTVEAATVQKIAVDLSQYPIHGQAELDALAGVAVQAKARLAFLEESRKAETRPHQAETKRIQDLYRAPESAYAAVLLAVTQRLSWHHADTRRAQEAAQLAAASQFAQAQAAPEQAPALLQAAHQTLAAAPAPAAAAGIQFRKRWTHAIENPELVPRELCSPDPAKIRAWVAAGGRQAPGLLVWQDETAAVTGKP